MDVLEAFEKAFGFDVMLENDVNLAVLGENWLGQGQGIDNLAYIALGTGIGGGLMVGGHLVRGATTPPASSASCRSARILSHAESLRTGAFERTVASHRHDRALRSAVGQASRPCPRSSNAPRWATQHADAVLDETARYLARGIAAIAAIANPQKVILGGSIGLRPEMIVAGQRLCCRSAFPTRSTVEASELGSRAAIIGAAAIGLSQLHNALFGVDAPDGRISLPPAEPAAFGEAAR